MKVIFIGGVYPPEEENAIRANSKFGLDNASNNLQWALIEGLDCFYANLTVVSMTPVRTFPRGYKKAFIQNSMFQRKPGSIAYSIGFVNIPIVKHLSIYINLKRVLKKLIDKNEDTMIINYGIHSPKLKAIYDLKKKNKRIKTCLIVPDLPQYMSESKNKAYLFLKKIDCQLINTYIKHIDSFVLLSRHMAERLACRNKPWIVVEGIYNIPSNETNADKQEEKIVLYTGNLGERTGVKSLLNAFRLINKSNYYLWIRGNGVLKKEVLEASKTDRRIKYFEEMSLKDLSHLMQQATVLVNPVSPQEEFSKYFFPSKIMNYMASGTPTITHRLHCIPEEYFDYCFVPDKEGEEGLRECIISVCEKPREELDAFGVIAKNFILNNKNPKAQTQKIFDLINSL